jgi:hypothetical protein
VVDDVTARVERLLLDWRETVTRDGDLFVVDDDTCRAILAVEPWGDDGAAVTVHAVSNWGVDPSPEFFRYVAAQADVPLVFGGLRAVERNDGKCNVAVSYALLGETLDPGELTNAVASVLVAAGALEAEIHARFGGERSWDES